MAFTPITVTGTWVPNPAVPRGTVSFRLYEALTDQDTLQVSGGTTTVALDDTGAISVVLAASDDPTSSPAGVPYLVTENIDNTQRRYYVVIPHDAAGGTVDLATLAPVAPPGATIPASSFLFRNLGDVDWSTPPVNGQGFVWSESAGKLIPGSGGGVAGSTVCLIADPATPTDGSASEVAILSAFTGGDTPFTIVPLPDLRAFIAGQAALGVTVYVAIADSAPDALYTVPAQPNPWVAVPDQFFVVFALLPQS